MSDKIHFEIFVRRGAKGSWTLLEAVPVRHDAIARAKSELGKGGVVAIKVTKETFQEDGTFQSVSILEEGDLPKKNDEKPVSPLPCFKPQDLFNRHARGTMSRVLKTVLDEWGLTPMELIHQADYLEKLEARSTVLQHAVQQVAVVQAAGSTRGLHEIFDQLMDLALRAMDMVAQDDRRGRLKPLKDSSVKDHWREIASEGDAQYLLASAIAQYLQTAKGWAAKLRFLLELLNDLPSDEEGRAKCAETIDSFIAEMVRSSASLHDLLGPCTDLGEAMRLMTTVFLGKELELDKSRPVTLNYLGGALKAGQLDEAKSALAERILHEVKSPRRLHPDSFEDELDTMRHLAQSLVAGVGPHLTIAAITDAFAARSKRIVGPESIEAYLAGADTADDKIERLILLEENVVGAQSKRSVADYLLPILSLPRTETQIGGAEKPVLARLKHIAEVQSKVRGGHFDDADKREILKNLDGLAARVAERAQIFKMIEQKEAGSADKALTLLRILANKMMPEGECETRAKSLVMTFVRRADFSATLMRDDLPEDERQARIVEFRTLFEQTGLKSRDEAQEEPAKESAA